jgi:ankyrin repeat protein
VTNSTVRLVTIAFLLFGIARDSLATEAEQMSVEQLFDNPKLREMAKAAERDDVATIERLVQDGMNVNATGRDHATILSRAFFAKQKRAYLVLLKHGADPNVLDLIGNGVINLSAIEPDPYWLDQSLRYGGNPNIVSKGNPQGKRTPLFYALYDSRTENVKLLLGKKANINYQDDTGCFPLYYAALKQDYHIVVLLLKAGADINLKTKFGHDIYEMTVDRDEAEIKNSQLANFREAKQLVGEMRNSRKRGGEAKNSDRSSK